MTTRASRRIAQAIEVLEALGLPQAQQNERSALCLLALLSLPPARPWQDAESPLLGVTPIMDWSRQHYAADYKPNTRETFRRQTIHQFVAAGIAQYNPDNASRPVNSPKAVYQITPEALVAMRTFGTENWMDALAEFLASNGSLAARYAGARQLARVPVRLSNGNVVDLSPGEHSELIRAVIEEFAPRFAPASSLIYVGDTGDKWGYFDSAALVALGVVIAQHGKMPDIVLHDAARDWLLLVESVTSHGPVDAKRHAELAELFAKSTAGLVFVTAFPNRSTMARYLNAIAWETEVWSADAPNHLIHFNGERFLGPYKVARGS